MDSKHCENGIASLGEACCGCGACAARCPKGCVAMEPDACGFLRPAIDADACIGCGACDAVCPVLNPPAEDSVEEALWAKADEDGLLGRSSSGGVFGLLARDVLLRGGVVAGAAWADGCRELRHVVVGREEDLGPLMRSKYVQSSVGREVYEGVRDALRAGRPALFCGTACQVAGMRSYLGGLADSGLFLGVDVVCHGVPSPVLWERWLGHIEEREGGEVRGVNFRSKETGWSSYSVAYGLSADGGGCLRVLSHKNTEDWYMRAFVRNASLRGSCLACPAKRRCGSDLTLGDFWGIGKWHPDVPSDMGVSAVVASTGRGRLAIDRISEWISTGPASFEEIASGNPSISRSLPPFAERGAFVRAIESGAPVSEMMRRWDFEPPLRRKAVAIAKRVAKRILGRH